MDLKKPYSIDDQIQKLQEHGVIVEDAALARNVLQRISYYRLTGYTLQYRINANSSNLNPGIKFEDIYSIYQFDEEVRCLLRLYIEKAEFYYKNVIGNVFAEIKCKESPYDQHYDLRNYYDKDGIAKTLQNFSKEKMYYRDSAIVKHHFKKYHDKMPLWVMLELMTCSSVSMFYHAMYISDKEVIADKIGVSSATLENHLHALSVLRNKCSHGVRLYNTVFNPPIRFNKSFLRAHQDMTNNSLFAYVLMLIKRLPTDSDRKQFRDKLNRILRKYEGKVDLKLIGFPDDYREMLYIKNLKSVR